MPVATPSGRHHISPQRDTAATILDAAVEAMARYGLARLAVEDVASEAGVSRQTVYRYFDSRDGLIAAAVLREEQAFIDRMVAAAGEHEEFRPALEAAIAEALQAPREHPFLDRLLETEPEALLPFLTTGRGPVLSAARPVVERLLGEWLPHLGEAELGQIADAVSRLMISYAINPSDEPAAHVAAGLADLITHGVKEPSP